MINVRPTCPNIRVRSSVLLLSAVLSLLQVWGDARAASPKRELRAVWIATSLGLDWPKSSDPAEQQASLRDIVARLSAANFNTIFFQVRGRADAMYRSKYEPWSPQLTGVLGGDPGWDPLAFVIREAHARGMEVHAWFNTVVAKNGGTPPGESTPRHPILAHPEWMRQVEGEWWFDPGIPAVREYLVRVAMDIVRNYDIDGFQFDFLRYPLQPFPDDKTYRRYGRGMQKADWRRQNINAIARAFHDSVARAKPGLKIGSAPIGIYENVGLVRGLQSYSELYQDSRRWVQEGWQDYLAPQVYWTLGYSRGDPDFAAVVRDWTSHRARNHLYIGVGAYKQGVSEELPQLIDSTRTLGADGNAFFRWSSVSASLGMGGKYRHRSLVPVMPWKDSIPPLPPLHVRVRQVSDGIFAVEWAEPGKASDGDLPRNYVMYRSAAARMDVSDPANIVAVLPAGTTMLIDTVTTGASEAYTYAVTALDRQNNESVPAMERIIMPELVSMANALRGGFRQYPAYPATASSTVFLPYELAATSPVILEVLDAGNRQVAKIVDRVELPGRHVAAADVSGLPEGTYYALLVAGDRSSKLPFAVRR